MGCVYIPATNADQWAEFLAEPETQWQCGFSARTLAYCWQQARGFPPEVQAALQTSEHLRGAELLLALPEHKVPLPGGRRASQNDVWALARVGDSLVSIAVEGKVDEPFGQTMGQWLEEASPGKQERLAFLTTELGIQPSLAKTLRYQLLHRAASALIEARRFAARHAVMLVHSFSPRQQWFDDFRAFAELFGIEPSIGEVATAGHRSGVLLHLGWVCGDARCLNM